MKKIFSFALLGLIVGSNQAHAMGKVYYGGSARVLGVEETQRVILFDRPSKIRLDATLDDIAMEGGKVSASIREDMDAAAKEACQAAISLPGNKGVDLYIIREPVFSLHEVWVTSKTKAVAELEALFRSPLELTLYPDLEGGPARLSEFIFVKGLKIFEKFGVSDIWYKDNYNQDLMCTRSGPVEVVKYCAKYTAGDSKEISGCVRNDNPQYYNFNKFKQDVKANFEAGIASYCKNNPGKPYQKAAEMVVWKEGASPSLGQFDRAIDHRGIQTCK